jgi:DnaK suppressor protein
MTSEPGPIVRALEERRSDLERELASLTAVPRDPLAAVSFGKRIGDGTTEAVDRLNNVGAANSIAVTLADVERALEKVADGTYGTCDACGEAITEERLEAIAWATLCISCARTRRSG